jgi:hypothetical protein
MSAAVCIREGCDTAAYQRALCRRHYRFWLDARPTTCEVPDCNRPRYAREVCVMHYCRLRATGQVGEAAPKIAARGAGHITAHGYRTVQRRDHPLGLARAQHRIEEHRIVLFDAIGSGPHRCHWCGRDLDWFGIPGDSMLVVDHLNDDRLNNDPSNLVPSCLGCNTSR